MEVPAILTREEFNEVQELMRSRASQLKAPRFVSGTTVLGGICFCADCGGAMTLRTSGKKESYRYYTCCTKARQGQTGCKGRSIPTDRLEAIVVEHIEERLLAPERIVELLSGVLDRRASQADQFRDHIAKLRRQAADADAKLTRLYDAIESGLADTGDENLKTRLKELRMVRDSAKTDADRAEARASDRSADLTPEIVKRFAGEAKRRLRTDAGDYRRHHLQALAQRIEVGEDAIRITGTRTHLLRVLAGEGAGPPLRGVGHSRSAGLVVETTANEVRTFVPNWLATDLLINVTTFFRASQVYAVLQERIVPDLVRSRMPDKSLRIWIAGCSTGEEAYSLAMLFQEEITRTRSNIKLQVFASDADPDAVAIARDGFYPGTIEANVSQARLQRFFRREDHGYRVLPELRAAVIFTVQDLLSDPPFSRLDLVSCRNVLIYLGVAAQAKVISLFDFALNEAGVLLLGNSETIGDAGGRFEVISKTERLYRHVAGSQPRGGDRPAIAAAHMSVKPHPAHGKSPSRQAALANLCRQMVLDTHAPAAVLINGKHECLYLLGPTDRYLQVAAGASTHDLLSMARQSVRHRLAATLQKASQEDARVIVAGGQMDRDGMRMAFNIDVQPVLSEGEKLRLVCFVDQPSRKQ